MAVIDMQHLTMNFGSKKNFKGSFDADPNWRNCWFDRIEWGRKKYFDQFDAWFINA